MALCLADFQGSALYLDTNVLVGLVDAQSVYHSSCAAFFQRALDPAHPIQLMTATLTVDEVVFVLLQEMIRQPPYQITRSRSQYLQDHPAVVQELMATLDPLVEELGTLVTFEPVIGSDIAHLRHMMRAYGLLPRDAFHLAVMHRLSCTAIASDDEGFDKVAGITRFAPV